jgi:hypothetical protein
VTSIEILEPYTPRPIRPLDTWQLDGWTLKLYGISLAGRQPPASLIQSARPLAAATLPQPPVTANRYGIGFVGVHAGRGADFVFVDWWENENEIHHVNFCGPSGEISRLEEARGAVMCVWDLRVLEYERRAWIDCVLANPAGPDLPAYLARRLNENA